MEELTMPEYIKVVYRGANLALQGETAIALPHPTDESKLLLQFDNLRLKRYFGPTGNKYCSVACTAPKTCHVLTHGWHEFYKKDLCIQTIKEKPIG